MGVGPQTALKSELIVSAVDTMNADDNQRAQLIGMMS
jgi:hypothetical protein